MEKLLLLLVHLDQVNNNKRNKKRFIEFFSLGKSTLCSLLVRFYDPLNGQIKIDGKDIRTLDTTWLRSNVIGMINQVEYLNYFASCLLFFTSII